MLTFDNNLESDAFVDSRSSILDPRSSILDPRSSALPVPAARVAIAIRPATVADLGFVDGLQRKHTKMVGWMPTSQLEGTIKQGRVLIAEEVGVGNSALGVGEEGISPTPNAQVPTPIGYCIGADRYFKRDDVGIIYQMNVEPGRQRGLIGANLLKAQFERSAYGCKLYCCWCAQDLAANKFWEAMGFVALAFRTGGTGGKGKARMHIFWQKRIRSGDTTTPWWFPGETSGGAIRENRIVLPIPPGTHWSDAKPIVLPGMEMGESAKALPTAGVPGPKVPRVKKAVAPVRATNAPYGLRFGPVVTASEAKPVKREKKERMKNDPRLVAAARELKDRWLEEINSGRYLPMANGKYEVSRTLSDGEESRMRLGVVTESDSFQTRQLLPAGQAA